MPAVIGFDYGGLWRWEDFDPSRLSTLMRGFHAPWWVAGGRALDLWMGRQTRAHQDVDVAVLRDDQKHLHEAFGGWELYYATTDLTGLCLTGPTAGSRNRCTGCGFAQPPMPLGCVSSS
jgi:hypothetical protein